MILRFRQLDVSPDDPVSDWGVEGILTAIDRGGLRDWRRIAEAIAAAPHGPVAQDLEQALPLASSAGARAVIQQVLDDARADARSRARARVRGLFFAADMTQAALAERLGTSRSRLTSYLSGAVVPSAEVVEEMARIARARSGELI